LTERFKSPSAYRLRLTLPLDPIDLGPAFAPVAVHHVTGGVPEIVYGADLTVDAAAGTLSFETTSLSTVVSSWLPTRYLPLGPIARPEIGKLALDAINDMLGLRADAPSCSPPASDQRAVATGTAFDHVAVLGGPPLLRCVQAEAGSARWKLANNTATAVSVRATGSARIVRMAPGGDVLSDLAVAGLNATFGGNDLAYLAPSQVVAVSIPEETSGGVDVAVEPLLVPSAFVLREIGTLLASDAEDARKDAQRIYDLLNGCGWSFYVSWRDLGTALGCAKSAATAVSKKLGKLIEKPLALVDALETGAYTLRFTQPVSASLAYGPDLPPPPGLSSADGTIVGSGPTSGVLWRLAGGPGGSQRGQPYLVVAGRAYSTTDPARAACLSRRYVLRDFVMPSSTDPLIWSSESGFEAPCPSQAPELRLPAGARNWILREPSGQAWFLNADGELEPITTGGAYIACAQRHLVLDHYPEEALEAFPGGAAPAARCAVTPGVGNTEMVSVTPAGVPGDGSSGGPSVSADGRYVAFTSSAYDLVEGDDWNGDVFVRDRLLGTTQRVSLANDGTPGNSNSGGASISTDGRFVAFSSDATNLVPGDTNGRTDVFVRDRLAGSTARVSVGSASQQGNDGSFHAAISADGRHVGFTSAASNLVAGDGNGMEDVFVRDLEPGTTERVSVATGGTPGNFWSAYPALSGDGDRVAFLSSSTNLGPRGTGVLVDTYVRDRSLGITAPASVALDGGVGNADSSNHHGPVQPALTPDGRFVAFTSDASNLVAGDRERTSDVFIRDLEAGVTERVSVALDGQPNRESMEAAVSADGRYVAFASSADNLVPNDTELHDVFLRDRVERTTERISAARDAGTSDDRSFGPALSADGRHVAFTSYATDLVFGDSNGTADVFLRTLSPGSHASSNSANTGR
jgi:Tol biopolymer transport system component